MIVLCGLFPLIPTSSKPKVNFFAVSTDPIFCTVCVDKLVLIIIKKKC